MFFNDVSRYFECLQRSCLVDGNLKFKLLTILTQGYKETPALKLRTSRLNDNMPLENNQILGIFAGV